MPYQEPKVSFLILDYKKPVETRLLIESIKNHAKFPHQIIYLHNGYNPDALRFVGLVDQFIMTNKNNGLGIGTRDLFAACHTPYAFYTQNDQILGRDITEQELEALISLLEVTTRDEKMIASIDMAGGQCGPNIYSERAHLIQTVFYKELEVWRWGKDGLPNGGAGPYHDEPWREGWMQEFYKRNALIHYLYPHPAFIDNGKEARRQNPDGSEWLHYPDTKQLWLKQGPVKEKYVYPKFTDAEWDEVIRTQKWPDGKIPEAELKDSFPHWHSLTK